MAKGLNRYSVIIEEIFFKSYKKGVTEINFTRDEISTFANKLGIPVPKNIGDVLYSFRYRSPLPASILAKQTKGFEWIIRSKGTSMYQFALVKAKSFIPNANLSETKILDATPRIINKYALSDEQALLAIVRYNRLIDIFTGHTCYSLQNHLRTTVQGMGQVETDEIYIGVDKRGVHYFIPVQAKGGNDKLGIVQIEQDFAVGESKFPGLLCKPIAAQFMKNNLIALFEFELTRGEISITSEKHYRLVEPNDIEDDELESYKKRLI